MKKKILLFTLMCACLISVLFVSSGAAEWFGDGDPGNYTVTYISKDVFVQFLTANNFTNVDNPFSASVSGSQYSFFYSGSSLYYIRGDGSPYTFGISDATFSFTSEPGYDNSMLDVTPASGNGFVTSGFSSAIGFAGTIAGELLDNSTIILAIGLAVGVTLAGWGIGKVKSLIKGY